MAESAYEIQRQILQKFGLPSAPDIISAINDGIVNGDSDSQIELSLQDTASWKTRFAGNEKRRAAGLNVLSVSDYLAQESAYAAAMQGASLPSGFYDDPSDYADFIAKDIAPSELKSRLDIASDIVSREDQSVKDQLSLYGVTPGQLLAHALDPERAAPLIRREQQSILIGAAAARSGFKSNLSINDRLAEQGIGEAQAQQGFGQVNDFYDTTKKLGDIYGIDFDASDAVGEVFEGSSGAKRKALGRTEKGAFSGQTNFGVARRDNAGSY